MRIFFTQPTSFKTIMRFQKQDKHLMEITKEMPKDYSFKQFHGAGKTHSLISKHGKIVTPKQIQKILLEWYHNELCHPGETWTKFTIGQHIH